MVECCNCSLKQATVPQSLVLQCGNSNADLPYKVVVKIQQIKSVRAILNTELLYKTAIKSKAFL